MFAGEAGEEAADAREQEASAGWGLGAGAGGFCDCEKLEIFAEKGAARPLPTKWAQSGVRQEEKIESNKKCKAKQSIISVLGGIQCLVIFPMLCSTAVIVLRLDRPNLIPRPR